MRTQLYNLWVYKPVYHESTGMIIKDERLMLKNKRYDQIAQVCDTLTACGYKTRLDLGTVKYGFRETPKLQ